MNSEYIRTRRAAEVVEAQMGFYIHAGVFAAVMIGLTLLNLATAPDELWVQWVILGWGLGVALHALLVFGRSPRRVRSWHLRRIRRLREQM
jgi:cell division protein FtsW (lipid II flippase)